MVNGNFSVQCVEVVVAMTQTDPSENNYKRFIINPILSIEYFFIGFLVSKLKTFFCV